MHSKRNCYNEQAAKTTPWPTQNIMQAYGQTLDILLTLYLRAQTQRTTRPLKHLLLSAYIQLLQLCDKWWHTLHIIWTFSLTLNTGQVTHLY